MTTDTKQDTAAKQGRVKTALKILSVLSLGVGIGIAGEFCIPDQYQMNITHQCVKSSTNKHLVFVPRTYVLDLEQNTMSPLYDPYSNVRSYALLFDQLSGQITMVSNEECDKLLINALRGKK